MPDRRGDKVVIDDKTVEEVYRSMSEDKQKALHIVLAKALSSTEIFGVKEILATFDDNEKRVTVFMLGSVADELFGEKK